MRPDTPRFRQNVVRLLILTLSVSMIISWALVTVLKRGQQTGSRAQALLDAPLVGNYRINHLPLGYAASRATENTGSQGETIYGRDFTTSNMKVDNLGILTINVRRPIPGGHNALISAGGFGPLRQSTVHGVVAYWYLIGDVSSVTWVETSGDRIQVSSANVSSDDLQLVAESMVSG